MINLRTFSALVVCTSIGCGSVEYVPITRAACVITRSSGSTEEVLILQESQPGRWDIPGGSIDPGELPAQAAIRETLEETGLKVVAIEHFFLSEQTEIFKCTAIGHAQSPDNGDTFSVHYEDLSSLEPEEGRWPYVSMLIEGAL